MRYRLCALRRMCRASLGGVGRALGKDRAVEVLVGESATDKDVVEALDNREAAEGRRGDVLMGAVRVEMFSLVNRAGAGVGGKMLMPGACEEGSVALLASVVVLPSSPVMLESEGATACSSESAENDDSEVETVKGGGTITSADSGKNSPSPSVTRPSFLSLCRFIRSCFRRSLATLRRKTRSGLRYFQHLRQAKAFSPSRTSTARTGMGISVVTTKLSERRKAYK